MRDRFSKIAAGYAAFRPTYPEQLYRFLGNHVPRFDLAWDAGTGNGQNAQRLAKDFARVEATDISEKMIAGAKPSENIRYSVAGETTDLPAQAVDLITVSQAIHWFNRDLFYKEVKRVAAKDAVIAVWGYSLLQGRPAFNKLINTFYSDVIGPWWDTGRKLIDDHYRTIEFPFDEISTPAFEITVEWTLDELEGYLNTWSGVQNYISAKKANPVDELMTKINPIWQRSQQILRFPVFLRLGGVR